MHGQQFIARLLLHVLPPGFKRIRHYGLLAPAAKTRAAGAGSALLATPAANPQPREDAQAFMGRVAAIEIERCPHCGLGRWRLLEKLGAERPALGLAALTACRGPA